jgi:hypothetical protein
MNGNPMHLAPRCGAKTRQGTPCNAPAIRGRERCRMHGGRSPGRPAIHGKYTKANIERRREWFKCLRELRVMIEKVEADQET